MHINKQNKHVHYEDMDFLNPYVLCLNKQKKLVQCEHMIHSIFFFLVDHPCLQSNENASKPPKQNQKVRKNIVNQNFEFTIEV
jgi:hypothetical protein